MLCLNFMKKLDEASIGMKELAYIEMFTGPLFRKVFPELCSEEKRGHCAPLYHYCKALSHIISK